MTAATGPTPHEERWLLTQLDGRPWREVLKDGLARISPALYARLTDSSQAAVLSLFETTPSDRCLDATGGFGEIAVPLARRARVTVLTSSLLRGAIVRRIAAQEGVTVRVVVGTLSPCSLRRAAFDVLLLHHPPAGSGATQSAAAAELYDAARLLRAGGRAYLGAANALDRATAVSNVETRHRGMFTLAEFSAVFANAGLTPTAAYACFPHHEAPRFYVPLGLANAFVGERLAVSFPTARQTPADAALAREGIAQHFAPAYAFFLQRDDGATSYVAPE